MDPVKRENTNPNFKHLLVFFYLFRFRIENSRDCIFETANDGDENARRATKNNNEI